MCSSTLAQGACSEVAPELQVPVCGLTLNARRGQEQIKTWKQNVKGLAGVRY